MRTYLFSYSIEFLPLLALLFVPYLPLSVIFMGWLLRKLYAECMNHVLCLETVSSYIWNHLKLDRFYKSISHRQERFHWISKLRVSPHVQNWWFIFCKNWRTKNITKSYALFSRCFSTIFLCLLPLLFLRLSLSLYISLSLSVSLSHLTWDS